MRKLPIIELEKKQTKNKEKEKKNSINKAKKETIKSKHLPVIAPCSLHKDGRKKKKKKPSRNATHVPLTQI